MAPPRRALTVLTALLVSVAATVLAARTAGLAPHVVLSGSMRPALDRGDLVLVAHTPATAARPGDVITFAAPEGRGRTLTHRVESVRREGDELAFVTRGDANPAPERWRIPASGAIGTVRATLPRVGYVLQPLSGAWARAGALSVLTVLVAVGALWLIWRQGSRR